MASIQSTSSPPPSDDDFYTVIMRGEEFQLTHDQISFDSPNFLTTCFTSGFAESKDRVLKLSRNPVVFSLIVEYLSGYPILPLTSEFLPPGMSVAMARRFLVADAEFYGLQRLSSLLTLPTPSVDLTWMGLANEVVSLHDVLGNTLPEGIVRGDDGSVVSVQTRLPVLVHVPDVLLRIAGPDPYRYCQDHEHPLKYELESSPSSTLSGLGVDPKREGTPLLTVVDVERFGSISIDGTSCTLGEVEDWGRRASNFRWYTQRLLDALFARAPSENKLPRAGSIPCCHKNVTYTFWADSVICIFPSRARGREQTAEQIGEPGARLVNARVRSMRTLISGMEPTEGGSRCDASSIHASLGILLSSTLFHTTKHY